AAGNSASRIANRAVARFARILPSQSNRLGPASIRVDRSRRNSPLRPRKRISLGARQARGPQEHLKKPSLGCGFFINVQSKRVLETKTDVNMFEISPVTSVTANPLTGPVPN